MPRKGSCSLLNSPAVVAAERAQAARLAELFAGVELVPPKMLAAETKTSTRTWERKRADGSGPPFMRIGSAVRYPADTLREWIRQNSVRSTTAATVAAQGDAQ